MTTNKQVLIVGAGFAGLTLANALQRKVSNQHHLELTVLDRLHPPTTGAQVGTIRVPSARHIFQNLGLWPKGSTESLPNGSNSGVDDILEEDWLLQRLRERVKIEYLHEVLDIVDFANKQLLDTSAQERPNCERNQLGVMVQKRHHCESFRPVRNVKVGDSYNITGEKAGGSSTTIFLMGPFDAIFVANGVRSKFRYRPWRTNDYSKCLWVLGDAAPSRGIGFLGRRRLTSGADCAMQDGMAVAKAYIQQELQASSIPHTTSMTDSPKSVLQAYRPTHRYGRTIRLLAVLFGILLAILCRAAHDELSRKVLA